MNDKISVLMPAYNREKYIGNAIKSILYQTHENLELIVYDDGSRDKTVDIVKAFMNQDKRIRLIGEEKNNGVAHARNMLLDAVNTEIACWQDSDDMSNVYRLKYQIDELREGGLDLAFGNYVIYRGSEFQLKVLAEREYAKIPPYDRKFNRGFATVMFRIDKVGRFNENKRLGGEDLPWLAEIEKNSSNPTVNIGFRLYYIRFHDDRIGAWKRKLASLSGFTGVDCSEGEQAQTYEEMIEAYKRVHP